MTSERSKWTRSSACLLASLLLSIGCGSDGNKDKTDPGDRDGGEQGEDGGDEADPDGGKVDPVGDAGSDDAGTGPGPITGGPGCGVDSLCLNLRTAYANTLQMVRSCTPEDGAEACGHQATLALGCESCTTWVTSTTRLDELRAQFERAECDKCFYGSPTGDRCHPEGCTDLGKPMCDPSGTCVPDLSCPDSAKDGASCKDSSLSYCSDGKEGCLCFGDVWMC